MASANKLAALMGNPLLEINLALFLESYPTDQRHELIDQAARARGIWNRLQREDVPGAILGDEVGKGKTYVALALAFATLAWRRNGRILVLTHSRSMAKTWAARWSQDICRMVHQKWRGHFDDDWKPRIVSQYAEFIDAIEQTAGSPAIFFASYDTLKRFHSHEGRRRHLLGALRLIYRAHGIRLSRKDKLRLVKAVVPDGGTMPRLPLSVNEVAAIRILKVAFDPVQRDWRRKSHKAIESFLDGEAARDLHIRPKIDLLIVDEAHKLEGDRRGSVVTHLLSGKFRKGVWVTATPFSLTLSELRRRLRQFEHAAGAPLEYRETINDLPLAEYQRSVSERVDFRRLPELQTALRRRMVRSTWNNRNERRILDWTGEATGAALLPTMVLERVISNIMSAGDRTHVASVRETLCSSWAATLESLNDGALARFRHEPWMARLQKVLTNAVHLDPKLCTAVDQLAKLAYAGEKTVVFTHRTETSAMLVSALRRDSRIHALTSRFQKDGKRWRERAERVRQALELPTLRQAYTVAKVIASSLDAPTNPSSQALKAWWRRHKKSLESQSRTAGQSDVLDYLEAVAGRSRRLPVVARYDGEVSGGDETEPDTVSNHQKFNLPCAPLILVTSRKGQEGIDLHHYCRRVVLYDLPWNPALIEQRIGRVHRLGGMRSKKRPVEVVYCYQKGSYEELIAQRVKRRCEMMHALLGAGTWLDQDREVDELERYRMTFPP
jgi:superfamily II DNA or RNA helicase